ncbi:Uncharacterised protein [Vibrio cholerae]|nr:Uncharacterised protein [Vibrio cholerae]
MDHQPVAIQRCPLPRYSRKYPITLQKVMEYGSWLQEGLQRLA